VAAVRQGIRKVTVACGQCGATESTVVATGRDREYDNTTADEFQIVQCVACGLRYLNPRPDVSELDVIYPPNYHAYNIRPPASEARRLPAVTRLRHRLYSRRYHRALRYLDGLPSIELLDVGCGDGWQLDRYRLAAPGRIVTYGVDFKPEVCEVARSYGHVVFCARFEDVELTERFDLANASHVIEHVADPAAFVKKVWEVLRPGGVFVVETPNIDTLDWKWFRRYWGAYHIPRHWTFYDPASLRRLGESAGFVLREVTFHPAPVHWLWTFNNASRATAGPLGALGRRLFAPLDGFKGGPKSLALLAAFSGLDMALLAASGRTSNMMAVFQKPSP
jgi:SAM-dependent methyltransferase